MNIHRIPFAHIPQLAARDVAYADLSPELTPFYQYAPTLDGIKQALDARAAYPTDRANLVEVLRKQYTAYPDFHPKAHAQLDALADARTFTVTTAHQPGLFTGPLYVVYKIMSTIRLAARLTDTYPDYHFVPVFVVGAEDHDFEEINHANLFGKTLRWDNPQASGAVGMLPPASLSGVLAELAELMGEAGHDLYARIQQAYTSQPSYGRATAHLLNNLFGYYGLVVLDMNEPALKQRFAAIMQRELTQRFSHPLVVDTQQKLEALGYSPQAHARELNLFYLRPGLRERIEWDGSQYLVVNTELRFTEAEILAELRDHPEHFSPNVVLRPLYQEHILPNLAYIGGGGELAYWLERKSQFAAAGVPYPVLIRRNSVLWLDAGSHKRLGKLGLSVEDLLEDTDSLIRRFVHTQSTGELSLAPELQALQTVFDQIAQKALEVDPTLEKAVLAEAARQLKAVEGLEGRLVRAEKQRHEVAINQIRSLRDKLFPGNGLQERHDNFIPYYLRYGEQFFQTLLPELDPLEPGLVVFTETEE